MRPNRVYLLHPRDEYLAAATGWIAEVERLLRAEPSWDDWDLQCIPYNERNGFDVQPLFVRVLHQPGPVLLLERVQGKAIGDLQEKLRTNAIVLLKSPTDPTELWDGVAEARRRHEAGEPLLPRKLVVAILIVRKLRNRNYWGGNAKGYLWHFDLANGRGVDDRFKDVAEEVANTLFLHDVLIKKTSQGQLKYALNPKRKPEVYAIAGSGVFENKHLERLLSADHRQESAEYLQQPNEVRSFTIISGGKNSHECNTAADAITHVAGCSEGVRHEAIVAFQNSRILRETFEEKRVLLQFLEAFR